VFITVDQAAMELRILSHVAKETQMQKAFLNKDDLHWYTGELIHDLPRTELTKEHRQQAKETSFLVVFGGSAAALAPKIGRSVVEAGYILKSWNQAYPAISLYKDYVYDYIREHKYAYSLFGRRRHLQNIKSPNPRIRDHALRQGMNFTIQSVASDILLCSLLGIDMEFKAFGMRSRIVQTVHDSGEFIVPFEELGEALEIIKYNMEEVSIMKNRFGLRLDVPLEAEFICGKSFGDGLCFSKGETPNVDKILEYMNG
jgi:DNA polymerase-1